MAAAKNSGYRSPAVLNHRCERVWAGREGEPRHTEKGDERERRRVNDFGGKRKEKQTTGEKPCVYIIAGGMCQDGDAEGERLSGDSVLGAKEPQRPRPRGQRTAPFIIAPAALLGMQAPGPASLALDTLSSRPKAPHNGSYSLTGSLCAACQLFYHIKRVARHRLPFAARGPSGELSPPRAIVDSPWC